MTLNLRTLFLLLAIIGLIAACILMVDRQDSRALVTAVLTTGLFVAGT